MFFSRVMIELTNSCNVSCIYCPYLIQKRQRQFMNFELFKKIIDDLFTNHVTEMIHFNILGEPLLHKDFFNMIAYLNSHKKYPIKLVVLTNGVILKKDSIQEALLNSSVNIVGISVRANDEYEYKLKLNQNYENSDGYDNYIESIKSFIRKVHEKDLDLLISLNYFHTIYSPYTLVSTHPFITKKSQILSLSKFWHELIKEYKQTIPIKKVKIPFSSKIGCTYGNSILLSQKLVLSIDKMMLWHNKLLPDDYAIRETSSGQCNMPQTELIITSSGDVAGCCNDFDCDINLGNLRDSSITDVITTKKYMDFKMNLKKGILVMPLCKVCIGTITKKDTGEELIFEPPILIKYYYFFVDNPIMCIKKIWNKIKKKLIKRVD